MPSEARPSNCPYLVLGNSHTTAVAAALEASPDDRFDVVNLASYFDPVNRRNKDLPPRIVDLFRPRNIFCTFGGSEHSVLGLLEMPVPFDFMAPDDPAVEPGRQLVAYGLMRATLERAMRRGLRHLRELRALYRCPITHVCTPPPFRTLAPDRVLPGVFMKNLHLGLSPASLRKKLHALHSDIARQACAEAGVGVLPVPDGCTDDDGFLREEYWSIDPTHGNALYGALVIRQMLEASHG